MPAEAPASARRPTSSRRPCTWPRPGAAAVCSASAGSARVCLGSSWCSPRSRCAGAFATTGGGIVPPTFVAAAAAAVPRQAPLPTRVTRTAFGVVAEIGDAVDGGQGTPRGREFRKEQATHGTRCRSSGWRRADRPPRRDSARRPQQGCGAPHLLRSPVSRLLRGCRGIARRRTRQSPRCRRGRPIRR